MPPQCGNEGFQAGECIGQRAKACCGPQLSERRFRQSFEVTKAAVMPIGKRYAPGFAAPTVATLQLSSPGITTVGIGGEAPRVVLGIDLLVFRLGTNAALRLRTG